MNVLHLHRNNGVFLISHSIIIVWWTFIGHNPSYILIKFHVMLTFNSVHWNNIMYLIFSSWYWLFVENLFSKCCLSVGCLFKVSTKLWQYMTRTSLWFDNLVNTSFISHFYACGFRSTTKLQQYAHCKQEATMEQ